MKVAGVLVGMLWEVKYLTIGKFRLLLFSKMIYCAGC